MAKPSAHQELAGLQKDAAVENVKAREAEDDVRRAHAQVEHAIQQLEDAYVTEDEQRAAKARKALALAQDEREDASIGPTHVSSAPARPPRRQPGIALSTPRR